MMADSNRRRWWLIGGAGVVAVVAGLFVWRQLSPRESTDDAQVSGHVSPLAARVGGTVKAVHVNDNQAVKAGDVLVEIDPHDYQIALSRAEADLAAAQGGARGARVNVPIASTTTKSELNVAQIHVGNTEAAVRVAMREVEANRAKLAAAQARLAESQAAATRASQDLARLRPLAAKDEISKQQLDAAINADQGAKAAVAGAEASIAEAQANVEAAPRGPAPNRWR
jgi:membrane fusion protein, multidrug efflux system